ncbi:MAG: hypothetical protein ACTSUV_01005 [Candidatus Ranarchaeia archaeon]
MKEEIETFELHQDYHPSSIKNINKLDHFKISVTKVYQSSISILIRNIPKSLIFLIIFILINYPRIVINDTISYYEESTIILPLIDSILLITTREILLILNSISVALFAIIMGNSITKKEETKTTIKKIIKKNKTNSRNIYSPKNSKFTKFL